MLRYPAANPLASGLPAGRARTSRAGRLSWRPRSAGAASCSSASGRSTAGQSWATYIPFLNALYTSAASSRGALGLGGPPSLELD